MSVIAYCRLCSKRSLANINIFGEQGKKHLLPFKILHFANVVIIETDPLPKFVCILCIGKLNFILNFRTQCQNAQTFFRRKLREIQLQSESDDVINVESKIRSEDEEISDEKAGTSVNYANTGCSDSENSNDTSNKVKESSNNKVTMILKYHEELSEEVGVKMEVEEVDDNEDNFENSENTNINSAKEDQKSCIIDERTESMSSNHNLERITAKIEDNEDDFENSENTNINSAKEDQKSCIIDERTESMSHNHNLESITAKNEKMFVSEKQKFVGNQSNTTQNENSKDLKVSDCESENDDYDYPDDDAHHPVTNVTSAEADGNEHSVLDSGSTKESYKLDQFSDDKELSALATIAKVRDKTENKIKKNYGQDKTDNANCRNTDYSRTEKVNKHTSVVIIPKVKEDLHEPDNFMYFSKSENDRFNQTGELFEQSYPRFFECISYIINRKVSVMPYFMRTTLQNNFTKYMFKCFVCKHFLSYNYSDIIKHLTIHLHLKCTFCNHVSRTNTRFKLHIKNSHYMELVREKIKCNYCDEKFSDYDLPLSHMKTHLEEHCGSCEFKSKDPDLLHKHTIRNHKNTKAACTNCATFYNNGFMNHLKSVKNLGFVCSSCEMPFHNEQHLNIHYKIYGKHHWSDKTIENSSSSSDNARKILDSDFSKLSHAKIIKKIQNIVQKKGIWKQFEGNGKSGPSECPWPRCKSPFPKTEELLVQHSQHHLLLACYECNKCYTECNKYTNHVKRKCKKTHFKCCICKNKTFEGLDEYISHVRDHQARRVCNYCFAILSDCRNEKRKHMRKLHHELVSKRVVCEKCGKSLSKSAYKRHLAGVHNVQGLSNLCSFCGELKMNSILHRCSSKPNDEKEEFICAYCSKVFQRKFSLRTHILVHMNEKSFNCSLCDKKFNRESSLTKHVKDMHAPRKWACYFEDCTKTFSFQSALKKHITTSH